MSDDRVEGFDASWAEVEARVDSYVADGLARVARWRWAPEAAAWEHPAPLWMERDGEAPPTQVSESKPEDPENWTAHGLEQTGAPVVSQRVDRAGVVRLLAVWPSPGVQLAFRREWNELVLFRVAFETRRDGRLVELRLRFDPRSGRRERIERYEHDAEGRVMGIVVERRRDARVARETYEVERDQDGALTLIRRRADGEEANIVFRRSDPRDVRAARRRVASTLVKRVPEWARRVAPQEPVGA